MVPNPLRVEQVLRPGISSSGAPFNWKKDQLCSSLTTRWADQGLCDLTCSSCFCGLILWHSLPPSLGRSCYQFQTVFHRFLIGFNPWSLPAQKKEDNRGSSKIKQFWKNAEPNSVMLFTVGIFRSFTELMGIVTFQEWDKQYTCFRSSFLQDVSWGVLWKMLL